MDVVMNTESTPHQELRAKIVAALNLTPLVPPQADTETLNVVEDAWAALSELMRSVEQYEEMKAAVDVWKTDALNWERHARDDHAKAKQLEEQLEALRETLDWFAYNPTIQAKHQQVARDALAASNPASGLHALTTADAENEPADVRTDDDFEV